MISVHEATTRILSHAFSPAVEHVSVDHATGKVLAEAIFADRDLPPFDRVTMDGIAIAYDVWLGGQRQFSIEGTQAAGQPMRKLSKLKNALEVMTGAIMPEGTDTVIRYEDLQIQENIATVVASDVVKGQSIHRQGQDAKRGELLLEKSQMLFAPEVALLASVGKSRIATFQMPATAVVSTGDELVDVETAPSVHQVRRSNTYALQSAMHQAGWPSNRFHFADDREVLLRGFEQVFSTHDIVIISGGVSKGKYDFIPEILSALGVDTVFHTVSQRPGKPFWFGHNKTKTVFALPGNPVSTFMCMHRYILPWMKKNLGLPYQFDQAILAKDFSFAPQLTYFLQVDVRNEEGRLMAYPLPGGGSGDFVNLKSVRGFLELPADRTDFRAGEVFSFIPFRQ